VNLIAERILRMEGALTETWQVEAVLVMSESISMVANGDW